MQASTTVFSCLTGATLLGIAYFYLKVFFWLLKHPLLRTPVQGSSDAQENASASGAAAANQESEATANINEGVIPTPQDSAADTEPARRASESESSMPKRPLDGWIYSTAPDFHAIEINELTLAPTISSYSTQTVRGFHALTTLTALISMFLMVLNVINLRNEAGELVQPLSATIINGICYFSLILVGAFATNDPDPNHSGNHPNRPPRPNSPLCCCNVPRSRGEAMHVLGCVLYLFGPTIVGIVLNAQCLTSRCDEFLTLGVISFVLSIALCLAVSNCDTSGTGEKCIKRQFFPYIFLAELFIFIFISSVYMFQELYNYA